MKIYFENLSEKLTVAVNEIKADLGIEVVAKEKAKLAVSVEEAAEHTLSVKLSGGSATVVYGGGIATFLRGLAMLVKWVRDGKSEASVSETPFLRLNGAMVDMSRNAVMNLKTVKFMMRKMALMGLNAFMLYTEDTYELENYPYFGYMRGRYTKEELKELDRYALSLGIELIPCIQTLGHLATMLKWPCAGAYKDTQNCMLVGAEATYKLIDEMLKTTRECFTTDRLHIGMDETIGLGSGAYLTRNGYRNPTDIYLEHLAKVAKMANGYGFKPMMWSDMIIEMAGKGLEKQRVYDTRTEITDEFAAAVPKNVQMVFWDYYNADKYFYSKNIENHKKLGDNTMFGGGIWTWSGFAPLYSRSLQFTLPALEACKDGGVSECIATIWHNGCENNLILSLAGLAWYADYGYKGYYDEQSMKECFAFGVGENYDDFATLQDVERPDGGIVSLAKSLVYNDPLVGLIDRHLIKLETNEYYKNTTKKLSALKPADDAFAPAFDVVTKVSALLENKASFGVRAKAAYDAGDKATLAALAEECDVIKERAEALADAHRAAWMRYNKPFGFEVMDIRYGGIIERIRTAKARINDYLAGNIEALEELEAERLRIDCATGDNDILGGRFLWRGYQGIATANSL